MNKTHKKKTILPAGNVTKIDEKFAVSSLRLRGTKQEAIRFSSLSGLLRLLRFSQSSPKKVKFTRLPGASDYWGRIEFDGLKGSVIKHCIFEYGGYDSASILYLNSFTQLTLNNVEINNSNSYGVRLLGEYQFTHSNVTFSNNRLGNIWDATKNPAVVRSHFP